MELGIEMLMAILIAALCAMVASQMHQTDGLKRKAAELQTDHAELTDMYRELRRDVDVLKDLLPRDNQGEVKRHELLLSQLNDELETSLRLEREWNQGVQSIIGYSEPIIKEE